MRLTDEQVEAVAMFRLGQSLRVEAGAGTGKTSTLRQIGLSTRRIGQFTAFNKAVVEDAALAMPENVACATSHSIAYRARGKQYRHRLDSGRMRSMEIARRLRIDSLPLRVPGGIKTLSAGHLASLTLRAIANFCYSADPEPLPRHVPYQLGIDPMEENGRRGMTNNLIVREALARPLLEAWADISSTNGTLPFTPDCYMKIWALDSPRIPGDFILLDEAQDTAPVLLGALLEQDAQLVAVGDSQQALYEWRGAINALAQIPAEATTFLTRSWRFGPAIAEVANAVLAMLPTELRISGCDTESRVGRIDGDPRAILCRTNAEAMKTVLRYQKEGTKAHLVGGGTEIASFARGAQQLQEDHWTAHPDLSCFTSWDEVLEYTAQDPRGDELRLMVSLVEEFTVEVILKALEFMPGEEQAAIIVSTAHKSKGREWPSVRLAGDFQEPDGEGWDGEWRLLYVAATRAREVLDISLCEPLQHLLDPDKPRPAKADRLPWEPDGGINI